MLGPASTIYVGRLFHDSDNVVIYAYVNAVTSRTTLLFTDAMRAASGGRPPYLLKLTSQGFSCCAVSFAVPLTAMVPASLPITTA